MDAETGQAPKLCNIFIFQVIHNSKPYQKAENSTEYLVIIRRLFRKHAGVAYAWPVANLMM